MQNDQRRQDNKPTKSQRLKKKNISGYEKKKGTRRKEIQKKREDI